MRGIHFLIYFSPNTRETRNSEKTSTGENLAGGGQATAERQKTSPALAQEISLRDKKRKMKKERGRRMLSQLADVS